MRRMILAGAIAALLSPPAQAGESQWACTGQAAGANDEAVMVWIHVTPRGERVASYASWDPPRINPHRSAAAEVPDITFSMMYHSASAAGLGEAGEPLIWATAFTPPGPRGRSNPEQ